MSIRLGEIEVPNVTLLGDMRDVIVSVKTSRNAVADELEAADAAGDTPEGTSEANAAE